MNQSASIGDKIKGFRQNRNLSQLELELAAGLTSGMISRIENNLTNPTKETIIKIAQSLGLNMAEIFYLFNLNSLPPEDKEVRHAQTLVTKVLSDPNSLAYLLDNRSCIVAISKGFTNLMASIGVSPETLVGHHVAEIMFNSDFGVRQFISEDKFKETAKYVLAVLHQERNYLIDTDPWWQELVNKLLVMPGFTEIWEEVKTQKIDVYSRESRTLSFSIHGKELILTYSVTVLESDPRFSLIEYISEQSTA